MICGLLEFIVLSFIFGWPNLSLKIGAASTRFKSVNLLKLLSISRGHRKVWKIEECKERQTIQWSKEHGQKDKQL